ncbi:class I SAM-dependent DNA methyltransferase [Marinicella marina]|uniref:class I SAM-dependent DNA methyltransferase n=1 Tax=Marinicella marina TaxID=2996016 RepID=UPI0024BC160F|nr:DNA methyltransferase [Marinicella marina]MDJ1138803.1 lactate dehydrogenase [Marinicella marina]
MNAVEIEEAVTALIEQPFDADAFPFAFLEAYGDKATTIKRLRSEKKGSTNASDLKDMGGVLQRNNIHILVCPEGNTADTLTLLRDSPSTSKAKAKFILVTDGQYLEAENLSEGESLACDYQDFPNHFSFFLSLAGISTVKQIRDSAFDIRATSRLNKLYVELLSQNPDWDTAERRHDMNHFMARLIFCFFAEDTDIFSENNIFTDTIAHISESNASNTHEVMGEIFRAMNTKRDKRKKENIKSWADMFPYVNGGLFSGSTEVPVFSKIARSYLLHVGSLDWTQINPDIFGSMIQAVADDEERGSLGMHYTSVPNILKVLNPLFLDDLREQLDQAGDNGRKLLNLRKRISNIRVFDPACGSGNFLVIAYKQMRAIEAEINFRRKESDRHTEIPLTNYRGIELRDFPAEIARLALIIAEYQCDLQYRGQKLALADFLPLDTENWITCGNALRIDWLSICPPTGKGVKAISDDIFATPLEQAEIDFENEGGETYICGNPPYIGDKKQSKDQKLDLESLIGNRTKKWKSLDYVCGWFIKAADYGQHTNASSALVSTNSISQGQQVPVLWPLLFETGHSISFAHTSFKWSNLASHNAGVIVVIVGISKTSGTMKSLFSQDTKGNGIVIKTQNISPYLAPGKSTFVQPRQSPISNISEMLLGNFAKDGGHLLLEHYELDGLDDIAKKFVRPMYGGQEFIKGNARFCFWIDENSFETAKQSQELCNRFERVKENRLSSTKKATQEWSKMPYRFVEIRSPDYTEAMVLPIVSSENRDYFPVGYLPQNSIVNYAFGLYDAPLWNMALIASKLHLVWIATVCGKMKSDYRYSNTLGWNTFPVPKLTEKNKADLIRCAKNILLAREAHFPATIADLYKPDVMPENLRRAHERNDEVLERIYIGRRFKNDTERLEKLFDLYTKMTSGDSSKTIKKVN